MIQIKALQITHLFIILYLCVLVNTIKYDIRKINKYSLDKFKEYCKTEEMTIIILGPSSYELDRLCKLCYHTLIELKENFVVINVDDTKELYPQYGKNEVGVVFIIYKKCYYIDSITYINRRISDNIWEIENISKKEPDTWQNIMKPTPTPKPEEKKNS